MQSSPLATSSTACGQLSFLGGAGTVTGSKHLVTTNGHRFLLDCGLFQGPKDLRLRNWAKPSFSPAGIEAVVLSHAHIDHSGYLPLLVRRGFRGPVYCTPPTAELLRVMLLDSARLEEEEAEAANRHGYAEHHPARPLYTSADAYAALQQIAVRRHHEPFTVLPGATAVFRRSGHILGAATVEVRLGAASPVRLVYSADLGNRGRLVLRDPDLVREADVLLVESTYGDRTHSSGSVEELAAAVRDAAAHSGAVVVPSFAVGRAQELVWILHRLEDEGRIPRLPIFVDSPVAVDLSDIYRRHVEEHNLATAGVLARSGHGIARTVAESKALNERRGAMIIIAGSDMATGGRVLHHLKLRLPDARATVLLLGYQAPDTRGRSLQDGAKRIRLFGQWVPVRARVVSVDGVSAHADRDGILAWLRGFERAPQMTYVVHGEPPAAEGLARVIREELGWSTRVAREEEIVALESTTSAGLERA
jgi:metallo-beta-lactamase family protein